MNEYKFYLVGKDFAITGLNTPVYALVIEADTDREALSTYEQIAKETGYLMHQQAERNGKEVLINIRPKKQTA